MRQSWLTGVLAFVLLSGMATTAHASAAQADSSILTRVDSTHTRAGKATLYVSWHAGWGTPGASASLVAPCSEADRRDTLVLTFDPGRDSESLAGATADVYFRAPPGDALGPMWWFGGGALNDVNLIIEYPHAHDGTWGTVPIAWKVNGFGAAQYDRTAGTGHLKIVFAVPYEQAGPVRAGQRYALARLLILRGKPSKGRCDQSICMEWAAGGLTFDVMNGEEAASISGGHRFASWNGRGGSACGEFSSTPATSKPKPSRH